MKMDEHMYSSKDWINLYLTKDAINIYNEFILPHNQIFNVAIFIVITIGHYFYCIGLHGHCKLYLICPM